MQPIVADIDIPRGHRLDTLAIVRANQARYVGWTHPPPSLVPQLRHKRRKHVSSSLRQSASIAGLQKSWLSMDQGFASWESQSYHSAKVAPVPGPAKAVNPLLFPFFAVMGIQGGGGEVHPLFHRIYQLGIRFMEVTVQMTVTGSEEKPRVQSRRGAKRQGRPPGGDSEATRRRIMDAAQLCFGEYGYRETSNRSIAEMAQVTTGTIYHYFENKRELFLAIHEATQNDITNSLRPIIESDATLSEAIDSLFNVLLSLYVANPNYSKFNAVVRTEALRNPEISSALVDKEWRGLYREFAERGLKTGELDKRDMRAMRAVLGAIILGLVQHGMEANVADHKECLRGMKLLFEGKLLRHSPV